ncbi:PilZ domain-containing protein [Hyphomonas adhaerens]|uniref:PilZ domain-containing protein n=1 Tax=Hyphomonas adhaerens TaxID=81029 RepID=UPI002354B0F0|nr:PilZ domain-containing protein [Hyphomonas adhaerens]
MERTNYAMAMKPRLFGTKKPDSPDLGRIQRTLQQSATPIASRATHQNMARAERAKVYREAAVAYDSGYRRKGVVLDYSANGARLRFPTNENLPPMVYLYARAVGLEGPARVVWQHGSEAGLALEV